MYTSVVITFVKGVAKVYLCKYVNRFKLVTFVFAPGLNAIFIPLCIYKNDDRFSLY